MTRLDKAKKYAEQAVGILETLPESVPLWIPLLILSRIAVLERDEKATHDFLRKSREAYISLEENRYQVDQKFGLLIQAVVWAATGDEKIRAVIESQEGMQAFENTHPTLAKAVQSILAGERDWQVLTEKMDDELEYALVVFQILETIRQSSTTSQQASPQNIFKSLSQWPRSLLARLKERLP